MSNARLTTLKATLAANALQRRTLDGREYAVAPVVALVAGVVNGELITADELAAFVAAWDGRPVPLRHPVDAGGNPISANSPQVIEGQVVGQVFNMAMDGERLVGEMWIDVEKCERLGGDALATLRRLEAGEVVEVSTGYFCEIDPTPGVLRGQAYSGIQRNLRPDHLALLPDQVGACSVAAGCGAGRFNRNQGTAAPCHCHGISSSATEENGMSKANEEKEVTSNDAGEAQNDIAAATAPVAESAAPELPAELTELTAALREFGGVAALMDAVKGIKANTDRQKAQIVNRLAVNSRCAFSKADLEAMSLDSLAKLEASIMPATQSYVGRNGAALAANAGDELRPYKGVAAAAQAAAAQATKQ